MQVLKTEWREMDKSKRLEAVSKFHLNDIEAELVAETKYEDLGKYGAVGMDLYSTYGDGIGTKEKGEKEKQKILGKIKAEEVYENAAKEWDAMDTEKRERTMIASGVSNYAHELPKSYVELRPAVKAVINMGIRNKMALEIVNKSVLAEKKKNMGDMTSYWNSISNDDRADLIEIASGQRIVPTGNIDLSDIKLKYGPDQWNDLARVIYMAMQTDFAKSEKNKGISDLARSVWNNLDFNSRKSALTQAKVGEESKLHHYAFADYDEINNEIGGMSMDAFFRLEKILAGMATKSSAEKEIEADALKLLGD